MPWSTLASNQAVSFNNLQDAVTNGIFTAKASIPASNRGITKTDATTYVNINTSNASYASKASNQLVVKTDLVAPSSGVTFTTIDGLYPLTGLNTSTVGTITNNFSSVVYIRLVFNSAGLNAGTVSNDTLYLPSPLGSISISGQSISSYGQNIFSNTASDGSGGAFAMNANSTFQVTIDKFDGQLSGSTLRIAYSTTTGGTYIPI